MKKSNFARVMLAFTVAALGGCKSNETTEALGTGPTPPPGGGNPVVTEVVSLNDLHNKEFTVRCIPSLPSSSNSNANMPDPHPSPSGSAGVTDVSCESGMKNRTLYFRVIKLLKGDIPESRLIAWTSRQAFDACGGRDLFEDDFQQIQLQGYLVVQGTRGAPPTDVFTPGTGSGVGAAQGTGSEYRCVRRAGRPGRSMVDYEDRMAEFIGHLTMPMVHGFKMASRVRNENHGGNCRVSRDVDVLFKPSANLRRVAGEVSAVISMTETRTSCDGRPRGTVENLQGTWPIALVPVR